MSDYEKAQADLNYVLSEDGHSSATVEKLLGLGDCISQQEQRLRELEAAVKLALDLSENGLIDYQKYGLTCHDDIEQKYRNALEPPR